MLSRNVDTFITVIELGSFTKAADRLYMSPVSVMNQMNALEDRIGLRLLERTKQGVFATPAGASLFQDAKQMKEFYESAILRARRCEAPKNPLIRIGTSLMNPCHLVLNLWQHAAPEDRHFNLSVVSFEDNEENMLDISRFLGSRIDFFVGPCGSSSWKQNFQVYPFGEVHSTIGVPRLHPLAQKDFLTLNDLHGETLVMPAKGDTPQCDQQRELILQKHHQIHLYDGPHFYSMEIFNKCVERGYLLHMHDIWSIIHPSIRSLPVVDPDWIQSQEMGIITTRDTSSSVRELIEIILRLREETQGSPSNPAASQTGS